MIGSGIFCLFLSYICRIFRLDGSEGLDGDTLSDILTLLSHFVF